MRDLRNTISEPSICMSSLKLMISLPSFVWRPVQVATVRDACAVTVGAVSFPAATAPQAVCCQRQNASEQQRSRS